MLGVVSGMAAPVTFDDEVMAPVLPLSVAGHFSMTLSRTSL